MRDPYSILGVSKSADQQEIKTAWRAAAKALHPDQNPGDPQAASRFTEAGRAYDLLKDPDKRRIFDESRARMSAGPTSSGPGGAASSGRAGKEKTFMEQRAERARAEAEAKAAADARARADARASAAAAAAAQKAETRDPADEAVDKIFSARKPGEQKSEQPEPQPSARTTARPQPEAPPQPEPAAAAAQEERPAFETPAEKAAADAKTSPALELITYVLKRLTRQVPPPEKAPDHIIDVAVSIEDVLHRTNPVITLADGKPLTVPMPDDVRDGTRIRFEGLGYRLQGVKRGDVVAVLRLKPHNWYRHHGYDLLTYVDVDIENAVLGCETTVETLDGPVRVTIPAWSGSQYKSVIPGRGLPKGAGERGDLIAEIRVHLWDRPDQRVIDLMRSMREGLYL